MPFDQLERDAILAEWASARERLSQLDAEIEGAAESDREVLEESERDQFEQESLLLARYRDGLPRLALSRCPFSGDTLEFAIDTFGLDGPWWRYDAPVRPHEPTPPTFATLTGALRISEPVETTPFLCKPGPEAPYVLPRLLDAGLVAVISSVAVGSHQGYAVAYFAPEPPSAPLANTWGANQYRLLGDDGEPGWDEVIEDETEFDFDLRAWIEARKARWIAPGDTDLVLREGADGCPYLDLPGRRELVRTEDGELW